MELEDVKLRIGNVLSGGQSCDRETMEL